MRQPLPIAEAVAIFVGVVGWNLLVTGQVEVLEAVFVAVLGAFFWAALRRGAKYLRRKQ